jgi:organic hydroperoxide reductase OsmC/OhrA
MATHEATVDWQRGDANFLDNRYGRRHNVAFDGGVTFAMSSAPSVVKPPYSDAAAVDPEEAFVAALASCHLLSFLYVAAKAGFVVDSYLDHAVGTMAKNARGKAFVSTVTLKPVVTFVGDKRPTAEEHEALNHQAHDECFIANSVLTDVRCEPTIA